MHFPRANEHSGMRSAPFHLQAVGRIMRLQAVAQCTAPVDEFLSLRGRKFRISVNQCVRGQRHLLFPEHLLDLFQLVEFAARTVRIVFVEIEFFFSFVHMMLQPPAHRLHFGIPGIFRVIAVAIVTGSLQDMRRGNRNCIVFFKRPARRLRRST